MSVPPRAGPGQLDLLPEVSPGVVTLGLPGVDEPHHLQPVSRDTGLHSHLLRTAPEVTKQYFWRTLSGELARV